MNETPPVAQIPGIEVVRSADRFVTRTPDITSRHCFSFGAHYNPSNVSFGALLCLNDERLDPGAGFPAHEHAGIDIVTWVIEGRLTHEDSAGGTALVEAGAAAVLRAGRGLSHSERNAGPGVCRFIQSWIAGGTVDTPAYERVEVGAGGLGAAQIDLQPAAARLHAATMAPETRARLPVSPRVHLFVVRGSVRLGPAAAFGTACQLVAGDSARVSDLRAQDIISGSEGAQIHAWALGPD